MPVNDLSSIVPAQLSFLAIYNPSLGSTDDTLRNQIVFYSSKLTRLKQRNGSAGDSSYLEDDRDGENERLREIGLAQGMVNFAKNFSEGKPVESAETEKSRIVLHELESDWWILASIDLTRLPITNSSTTINQGDSSQQVTHLDYSSREVTHPHVLVQQLRRGHSIFLLHHDISLDSLYYRVGRPKFCQLLARFWNKFIQNWTVILNGNPAVDAFNGIKLAAGGELGIGVGEEEWGSGEREVLEHFILRTHGLVDLVVSRFGDSSTEEIHNKPSSNQSTIPETGGEQKSWLGSDRYPRPSDGVIFSGIGAISRESLCRVSQWMEWLYQYGDDAYGVIENPSSTRRRRHKRGNKSGNRTPNAEAGNPKARTHPNIPPPLVIAPHPSSPGSRKEGIQKDASGQYASKELSEEIWNAFGAENLMKVLTLGYGSAWKFPSMTPEIPREDQPKELRESRDDLADKRSDYASGRFIIGLRDDLENEDSDDEQAESAKADQPHEAKSANRRTLLRTLHLRMTDPTAVSDDEEDQIADSRYRKLQVVVYVHQPFMFTFLFDLRMPALVSPSFYRSIHHQLGPLQKSLVASTSPTNVSRRIYGAIDDEATTQKGHTKNQTPLYDLIYDPSNLTIRSSIPNIPIPGISSLGLTTSPHSDQQSWSRLEALNVHNHVLSVYTDTRNRPLEEERTCKTSRGWWVIWVRVPGKPITDIIPTAISQQISATLPKELSNINLSNQGINTGFASSFPPREALIIHKSNDTSLGRHSQGRRSGSRFLRDLSGASVGSGSDGGSVASGAKNLTEGFGFDAHKHVESLLSLNR